MARKKISALVLLFLSAASAVAQDLEFVCVVEPEMTIELGAPVPGLLDLVSVGRGDNVKQGEVVAVLVSEVEKASVELAKARKEMLANLESAEIRHEFSERKYKRSVELSQNNYVADSALDEAKTEMYLADKALKEANESRVLAEAELKRAQASLALRQLKSPVDGVVVKRYHHPGERVDDEPILRIVKMDNLHVIVQVPVNYLGRIKKGSTGNVVMESNLETSYQAVVDIVDPIIDSASGLFGVRLNLQNSELLITPGQECTVTFPS